ncbi:MAG: hypothetical protein LUE13_11670 [Akkermansiaceae bacterium]|nr:hypothetical protein [Akkermansiaceae bacterium]
MIRFVLFLLCLGTAGLSHVFAEEGAAPSDYDKQERTGTLAPYQPEPRKEMHIQRPEHPIDILPALPDPAPQHQKPGGSSASEELPPGKGQTATP